MEYFIGFFLALVAVFATMSITKSLVKKNKVFMPRVSQSKSFELLAPYLGKFYLMNSAIIDPEPITQSRKYSVANSIRLVIYNNNAYWIHNSNFYTAKVVNGNVDKETTKSVDTTAMSTVELDELSTIVEKLREGTGNDSSNSGNQGL